MSKLKVTFSCLHGDQPITGDVVNPGNWFGKVWVIQVAIANALNPFVAVEADTEQDAIDALADSEEFGNLININDDYLPDDEEKTDYTRAGNDGHWVDLTNVHMFRGTNVKYHLEWESENDNLSSAVESELADQRDEE